MLSCSITSYDNLFDSCRTESRLDIDEIYIIMTFVLRLAAHLIINHNPFLLFEGWFRMVPHWMDYFRIAWYLNLYALTVNYHRKIPGLTSYLFIQLNLYLIQYNKQVILIIKLLNKIFIKIKATTELCKRHRSNQGSHLGKCLPAKLISLRKQLLPYRKSLIKKNFFPMTESSQL